MPCFHWLFTKRQMSLRTAEVRSFFIFFFALVEARVKPGLLSELI